MHIQKVLVLTFGVCFISAFAKSTEEQGISTEAILKKELERFEANKKNFEDANLNVHVIYTYPFEDESGTLLKRDTIELRPKFFMNNPDGPKAKEKYGVERVRSVFAAAAKWNLSSLASRLIYDDKGVLQEKIFITDDLKISLKDGNTHMILHDSDDESDDDKESIQHYIKFLKEFELPNSIEVKTYNEAGEVVKTDTATYEPKKVHILKSDMKIPMRVKVVEALRRAGTIESDPKERIKLLHKYLSKEYPDFTINVVMGEEHHNTVNDVYLRAKFDEDVYVVSMLDKVVEE